MSDARELSCTAQEEVPGAVLSAAAEATVGLVDDGVAAICTNRRGDERKAWLGRLRWSSSWARQRIAVDIARLAMVEEDQDAAANSATRAFPKPNQSDVLACLC